ncbi:MAG: BON domain-containing protein [Candidatus Binatia bacterium]
MRITALSLALIFVVFGCSKKDDVSKNNQSNQSAAVAPDNSGRNERDRDNATKTAGDQSESEADRTISQKVRQAIVADDSLSTNAKNVKIITVDGVVTLRGPVKNETEKNNIDAKARQVAGVKNVENQLEIAS